MKWGISWSLVYVGDSMLRRVLDLNLSLDFLFTGFLSGWKYRPGRIDSRETIEHILESVVLLMDFQMLLSQTLRKSYRV